MKTKNLKSSFTFCILHLTCCIHSNAQIVYTDVVPDVTKDTNGAVYHLDLNNDGVTEFDISVYSGYLSSTYCSGTRPFARIYLDPTGTNNVMLNPNYPASLIFNAQIDGTQYWGTGTAYFMATDAWNCIVTMGVHHWVHTFGGPWINVTDRYLGLRFVVGGNTYYGWARLNAQVTSGANATFTIKDYAYNSIPNQFIHAGDTGATTTGIIHNNIQENHLSIYPNPATNSISIKFPSHEAGEISIVNLFGQIVYSKNLRGFQNLGGLNEIKIDVTRFSEGMYVVRWRSGENNETKIFSVIK